MVPGRDQTGGGGEGVVKCTEGRQSAQSFAGRCRNVVTVAVVIVYCLCPWTLPSLSNRLFDSSVF